MEIQELLKVMVERDASDLYLTVESPPMYRINGATQPVGDGALTNEQIEALAYSVMKDKQRREFGETMEMNLALFYPELGRFRVNIFRQRGNVGLVIRQIKVEIIPLDCLIGIVGVEGPQAQVAGLGKNDRRLHGFGIADLTDEDHVRGLA